MEAHETRSAEAAPSLRERKKQRTRDALAEAATRLFTERGFEDTTLDELVEEVEVSKRTFFRYYASKEEVALAAELLMWDAFVAEVADRPIEGTVLTALRGILLDTLAGMPPDWDERFYACRRLAAHSRTSALRDHSMVRSFHVQLRLAEILGERLGIAVDADVRLRLLGEFSLSAWRCAAKEWVMGREPGQSGAPAMDATPDPLDYAAAVRVRGGRARLLKRVEEAFDAIPASLALSGRSDSPR